jgi:hypothetical protein
MIFSYPSLSPPLIPSFPEFKDDPVRLTAPCRKGLTLIAPAASPPVSTPAPTFRVQQAIFHGVAAADGARVVFASLTDGRCALLLDDRLVAAWGNDVYGIDVAVCAYLEMTGVSPRPTAARRRALPRSRLQAQVSER